MPYKNIKTTFNKLVPYQNYSYSVENLVSNWPVKIFPQTGLINSTTSTSIVDTNIYFCDTINNCSGYLPYHTGTYTAGSDPFVDVRIELDSDLLPNPIYGPTTKVICSGCANLPTINTLRSVSLSNSNIYNMDIVLGGLRPYTSYTYEVIDIDTNHLVGFKNLSGIIYNDNSPAHTVPNSLIFCESSGYCNDNNYFDITTTGNINNTSCLGIYTVAFAIKLTSEVLSYPVISDPIEVNCDNCVPKLRAILPNSYNLSSSNLASVIGTVSGLKVGQAYNYSFSSPYSNWPTILDNISGSFIATNRSDTVSTKALFCYPSGLCYNEPGLLNFTLDSDVDKIINENKLLTKLILNISTSGNCAVASASSNTSTLSCNNCLPCLRYADLAFSGAPVVALQDNCCIGQQLLSVNVSNAIPGEEYSYVFSAVTGVGVNKLELNPISGNMYFGSGGAGTINTICAVDLLDYTQAIVNLELTHKHTNYKVLDSVVIVCNTGSCY